MEDIIINPADKGGAVVAWRKDLYISEAERQLSDATAYTEVHHDPTEENQIEISHTVETLIHKKIFYHQQKQTIHPYPKTQTFTFCSKFVKKTDQEDQLCQHMTVLRCIYLSFLM